MATSGTVTWRPEIAEIITEAYERCLVPPGGITVQQVITARRSLNLMFAEWSVRGINYWTTSEATLALVASTRVYSLPAGTIDVLDAVVTRGGNDTTLTRLGLSDYSAITTKTTEGLPVQFFFDRQYTPQIYVWPVPENSTDTITYWQFSQMDDVTDSQQDADIPYRWTEAMASGLAARLGLKTSSVDPTRLATLTSLAETAFDYAADEEGEKAALRIIPA